MMSYYSQCTYKAKRSHFNKYLFTTCYSGKRVHHQWGQAGGEDFQNAVVLLWFETPPVRRMYGWPPSDIPVIRLSLCKKYYPMAKF